MAAGQVMRMLLRLLDREDWWMQEGAVLDAELGQTVQDRIAGRKHSGRIVDGSRTGKRSRHALVKAARLRWDDRRDDTGPTVRGVAQGTRCARSGRRISASSGPAPQG